MDGGYRYGGIVCRSYINGRMVMGRFYLDNSTCEDYMKDTGGSAFPVQAFIHPNGNVIYGENGMTLRDYFAGQALNGIMSGNSFPGKSGSELCDTVAIACYSVADAMIAERGKV